MLEGASIRCRRSREHRTYPGEILGAYTVALVLVLIPLCPTA